MENLTRLATYANWPTELASVSCLSLANSGFEYTGIADQVKCPLCGLVIKDWQRNMTPLDVHRLRSPQCSFFSELSPNLGDERLSAGVDTGPADDLTTNLRRDSSSAEQTTPDIISVYQSAMDRAMRHGVIDNYVRQTGNTTVTSRGAETGARGTGMDRTNPDYGLLKSKNARLSTFDDWPASDVVQPSAMARAGLYYTGQSDRTRCAFCRGVLHCWQPGDDPADEHRRHFPYCPFVRQRDVGNVPLQRDASLDRHMSTLGVEDVRHFTSDESNATATAASASAATFSPPDDEKQMLMEENRRLHDAKTCKVCMDRDVNTVFLPCGHLVSCDQCAPKLRNCPVCRTYIRGTVKTFLS